MQELKIDPEFAAQLRPLDSEEKKELKEDLLQNGCIDPIVVWEENPETIVDGHHRYAICREMEILFEVKTISFPDREAVLEFIESHQLGRRNLTPIQVRYCRGREYLQKKQKHGGQAPVKGRAQNELSLKTAKQLGDKHGVSPATIKRDGVFATELDGLPLEERTTILNGKGKLKRKSQSKQNKPIDTPVSSNGTPLTPTEKIEQVDAQLGAIKVARTELRKVLNTSLLSIPRDRLREAHKTARALLHSLDLDIKTLEKAYKQACKRSTKKARIQPNQKKKSKPRAASVNRQPAKVPIT